MSTIDFSKRINYHRYYNTSPRPHDKNPYAVVRQFESDRGRILNSTAIRQLQQKTQVFPLERNALVRTRLTHSLEVQQMGRHIFKEIIATLSQKDRLSDLGLSAEHIPLFESIVEMACLMHDIGNPPFGHFGESAINHWFRQKMAITTSTQQPVTPEDDPCDYVLFKTVKHDEELNALKLAMRSELCQFEGNAQTVRLIHTLLKLNLTYAQISCVVKYVRPGYELAPIDKTRSYLMKKPGFYLSEKALIDKLQKELHMAPHTRYPFAYVMEAADDIAYCIADLEDAVEKQLFSVDQLHTYLSQAWGDKEDLDMFDQIVTAAYAYYEKHSTVETGLNNDDFFMSLRINTINKLVMHAVERFIENIQEIYHGTFNQPLLAKQSGEVRLLEIFKSVAARHVFSHKSVENLELQGHKIIHRLLDSYGSLLALSTHDFGVLAKKNHHEDYPIESRLYHRLPVRLRVAYCDAVKLDEKAQGKSINADFFAANEFYFRCRLLQDYISGMTDHFAYDDYRNLMVIE